MREKRYAATKVELANTCDVSYQQLLTYWKLPGRPKDHSPGKARYDIKAWREFIAPRRVAHNAGSKNGQSYPPSPQVEAATRKNNAAAARIEFAMLRDQREYWPRKEVNAHIDSANAIVVRDIRKAFEQELPPRQDGMTALEIRKMNRKRLDEIFRSLPKHLKNSNGEA